MAKSLSPFERAVIRELCLVAGLSTHRVARLTGSTAGTVSTLCMPWRRDDNKEHALLEAAASDLGMDIFKNEQTSALMKFLEAAKISSDRIRNEEKAT